MSAIEIYDELVQRMLDGTAQAGEIHALGSTLIECEALVKERLGKLTLAQLQERHNSYYKLKKARAVNTAFDAMLDRLAAAHPQLMTWGSGDDVRQIQITRIQEITQEMLVEFAAKRAAERQALVKALTNPETMEEFRTYFIRVRDGFATLGDEQVVAYDTLYADDWLKKNEAEISRRALVERIDLGEVEFQVREDTHTKKQCPIWVVSLSERVDREKFNEIAEKAARFGARWSSWGPSEKHGFIFWDEDDAAAFMDLADGDGSLMERWARREQEKQERATERLTGVASTIEGRAEAALTAERKVNTVRRAEIALHIEKAALEDKYEAAILRAVAEALAGGELKYLTRLRFATQVQMLEYLLQRARDSHVRAVNGGGYPASEMHRPIQEADIRYARLPLPRLDTHDMTQLERVRGKRGTKYLFASLPEPEEGVIYLKSKYQAEAAKQLAKMAGAKQILDDFADLERLWVMGIDELPVLRAALREYLRYRPGHKQTIDPVRQMELDLVGLRIPGFIPTPVWLADDVVEIADIEPWMKLLEPEGGSGRIAEAIRRRFPKIFLDVLEINPTLCKLLGAKGYNIHQWNFLEWKHVPQNGDDDYGYHRILMNPPFEDGSDILHVRHAYNLLAKGGRIVAIMSEGPFFRGDHQAQEFRAWLEVVGGFSEPLPPGTFNESGTGVNSRLVVINKVGEFEAALLRMT